MVGISKANHMIERIIFFILLRPEKDKKNLQFWRFLIRGKKVAFQKLISDGDSGFGIN